MTDWNLAAERIFGYSQKEAIGRHAAGLIVPESAKAIVDQVWQDLLTRRGGSRSTNENITKDGQTIVCEWYNTPLIDQDNNVLGVASLVQDITEQSQAYERRAQQVQASTEVAQEIAAAPALGRLAMVIAVGAFPYARESGTGARIAAEVGKRQVIGALALGAAIAVGLLSVGGLLVFAMALALAVAGGGYARRRLGGLTGDVYGAVNEVVEVVVLLVGAVALG